MQICNRFIAIITTSYMSLNLVMQITHMLAKDSVDAQGLSHIGMERRSTCFLGLQLVTNTNGLNSVDLFTELFYANSAIGKTKSQLDRCSTIKHRNKSPKVCWPPQSVHQSRVVSSGKLQHHAHFLLERPQKWLVKPNVFGRNNRRKETMKTNDLLQEQACHVWSIRSRAIEDKNVPS